MDINNYFFANHLDEKEKIHYIAHAHPFVLLKLTYKIIIFFMILPIVLAIIFPQFLLGSLVWFFVGICGFVYHYGDWYLDAWIITNFGVIDVEVIGFFKRTSKRVDYHMIEGIAYEIDGFFHTMFNFGDITVDKIGSNFSMTLKDATNPKKVERIVYEQQKKYMSEKSIKDSEALKLMLSEMLMLHNNDSSL